jgi:hypothetical protein
LEANVAGTVSFDSQSVVIFPQIYSDATPGTDYPQLSASGDIALNGAQLSLGATCGTPLSLGDQLTLVTTTGSLSGEFSEPGGAGVPVENGAVVGAPCEGSSAAVFFQINYSANAVTATVLAPMDTPPETPSGAISVFSASSGIYNGTATAFTGPLTAQATGTGGLTVAQYASDPDGSTPAGATGTYLDVAVSSDNQFRTLAITVCGMSANQQLDYYNGSSWVLMASASFDPTTNCEPSRSTITRRPLLSAPW